MLNTETAFQLNKLCFFLIFAVYTSILLTLSPALLTISNEGAPRLKRCEFDKFQFHGGNLIYVLCYTSTDEWIIFALLQGRNTYTGSGFEDVNVGFTGNVAAGLHQFPKFHPFPSRSEDRRHRDMSHEEAHALLMKESGRLSTCLKCLLYSWYRIHESHSFVE